MFSWIYHIIVGGLAGWLAGNVMRGKGFGFLWNIAIGIIGGVVGGWLFGFLGIYTSGGLLGSIITAMAGAIVILFIAGKFKKS